MIEQNISLQVTCLRCSQLQPEIRVATDQLIAWRNGAKIQDCMPELRLEERELLISGTCGRCFDKMFGEPN